MQPRQSAQAVGVLTAALLATGVHGAIRGSVFHGDADSLDLTAVGTLDWVTFGWRETLAGALEPFSAAANDFKRGGRGIVQTVNVTGLSRGWDGSGIQDFQPTALPYGRTGVPYVSSRRHWLRRPRLRDGLARRRNHERVCETRTSVSLPIMARRVSGLPKAEGMMALQSRRCGVFDDLEDHREVRSICCHFLRYLHRVDKLSPITLPSDLAHAS